MDGVLSGDEVSSGPTSFLLDNDTDADGDTLEIISISSAIGSDVYIDQNGTIFYDPTFSAAVQNLQTGETIDDVVTYTVSDGKGGTATAEVSLTVGAPDNANPTGLTVLDIASEEQSVEGTSGFDSFIIDGNSSDYYFGTFTEADGEQGAFVNSTASDLTDFLYGFEEIKFDDQSVLIDDIA